MAILTRDFGYTEMPCYGHAPMRHLFAWRFATKGLSAIEITELVAEMRANAGAEGEVIPVPYVLETE